MAVELFEQFLSPFIQNRSVIFEMTYQLYDYFKGQFIKLYHLQCQPMLMLSVLILTVYCNKGIKTVKSIKLLCTVPGDTFDEVCFSKFQSLSFDPDHF